MMMKEFIQKTGDFTRKNEVYFSVQAMDSFAEQLKDFKEWEGILITPYLITESGAVYELHYYEFDIEIKGNKTYYVNYLPDNLLPKEITDHLNPQIVVAEGDKASYVTAIQRYLNQMKTMQFSEEKNDPRLRNAKLFYQIFTD